MCLFSTCCNYAVSLRNYVRYCNYVFNYVFVCVALVCFATTLSHYVTTCITYVVALARAVTTLSHYVTTCFAYVVALARVVTTLSHFAPTRLSKCVIST